MNRIGGRCAKCFSVFLLTSGFLISSEMPLLANPQSSSPQSSSSQPISPQSITVESAPASDPAVATAQKQNESLPDAPQSQPAQTPANQQSTPSGAAGAKAATVKGAPAAQPAGAAVAPPRQHGHRSLLIKMGLLAGAGIAVGTVVGLSARGPARPPGAPASTRP